MTVKNSGLREIVGKKETGVDNDVHTCNNDCQRPACVAVRAEREKVAQWMIQRGYATGHGNTLEDLLQELDWQIAKNWTQAMVNGVKTERNECVKLCDWLSERYPMATSVDCADLIRIRGEK
jgi:hypothetical protein